MRPGSERRSGDVRTATSVREMLDGQPTPDAIGPMAHYDELTELPNQQSFHDHVARAIGSTRKRSHHRFAVLLIDLDELQRVIDTFGRELAQKLLAVTARRLELCVGAQDIVARVGTGTFAILLPEIGAVSAVDAAAERVVTLMHLPAIIDEQVIRTTVRVGIAIGNATHRRPHEVLREASAAGRNARGAGRASAVDAKSRHGHTRLRHEVESNDDTSGNNFEVEREAGRREAVGAF